MGKDKNLFQNIFSRHWDNVITGIVAGLIVYYGLKIGYTLFSGIFIFLSAFGLVLIYSLFTWSAIRYKWDKKLIGLLRQRWKLVVCLFVGIYVYTGIHELLHYYSAKFLGYTSTICWFCFPTKIHLNTDLIFKNHYFIIAITPYILTMIILTSLILVYLFTRKKYIIFISIIPLLDYFTNILGIPIAYFTKTANDFLNLFRLGFYWETLLMMTPPIIFILFMLSNKKTKTNDKNRKNN